jgi:hypothetical protein
MTKPTATAAAAQQKLTDAKAELVQLKSERIAAESTAARLQVTKLASKASLSAFRTASAAHVDALADLERCDLLVTDAETAVRTAEVGLQRATFQAEAAAIKSASLSAVELAMSAATELGRYAAYHATLLDMINEIDRRDRHMAVKVEGHIVGGGVDLEPVRAIVRSFPINLVKMGIWEGKWVRLESLITEAVGATRSSLGAQRAIAFAA